jgi:HEAT repeat protein
MSLNGMQRPATPSWATLAIVAALGAAIGIWLGYSRPESVADPALPALAVPDLARQTAPDEGRAPTIVDPETVPEQDLPQRALDRSLTWATRNRLMERLSASEDPVWAMRALTACADAADDDVIRSWAVQHLGLIAESPDQAVAAAVLAEIRRLATSASRGTLVRREALFALATVGTASDRALVTGEVRDGLQRRDSELDLHARLAGLLRLTETIPQLKSLLQHEEWSVRGSAREALALLDTHGR